MRHCWICGVSGVLYAGGAESTDGWIMRLSPTEILKYLGFDISEDGVVINNHDAYLVTESLVLAGKTIDTNRIPADKLIALSRDIGCDITKRSPEDIAKRMRQNIEATLVATFRKKK